MLLLSVTVVSSSSSTLPIYPAYYQVIVGPGIAGLEDVLGYYSQTGMVTTVDTWSSPIYWKMSPMMYMLQEKASGDWIIAEDAFGQHVWMRQTSEYIIKHPVTNITWIWNEDPNLSISGIKVEARPYRMCDGN